MNKLFTTLLTLAALSIALPATADACLPTTSKPEIARDGMYIDNDACLGDCIVSIWVYEESNGIKGLQRSDRTHDDTCGGQIEADTQII